MARFLNTRGKSSLAVGICDRSRRKVPIGRLVEDPNVPGLRVLPQDRDEFDPYRLQPPAAEDITVRFARPERRFDPAPGDFNADFNADFGQ